MTFLPVRQCCVCLFFCCFMSHEMLGFSAGRSFFFVAAATAGKDFAAKGNLEDFTVGHPKQICRAFQLAGWDSFKMRLSFVSCLHLQSVPMSCMAFLPQQSTLPLGSCAAPLPFLLLLALIFSKIGFSLKFPLHLLHLCYPGLAASFSIIDKHS